MRKLYGNDLGHDLSSRRINSNRIQNFCKLLDDQNIHVVCSILSIFPDAREWCRQNLSSFAEIYIESPLEELLKRDSRGIYSNKKVAGISLDFPIPENPEMKISNSKDLSYLLSYTKPIVELFQSK